MKLAHKFASTKSVQEEMKLKFNSEVKFKFLSITLLFQTVAIIICAILKVISNCKLGHNS